MKQYEYTVRYMGDNNGLVFEAKIAALNEMGKEGWILCSHYANEYTFRREIKGK